MKQWIKRFKIPVSAIGVLIFGFLIFQNSTCGGSSTLKESSSSSGSQTSSSSGGNTSVQSVSLSPATGSAALGATYTLTASGGQAPYTFSVIGGFGSVSSTGVFTAPGSVGTAIVMVRDSAGGTAYAYITVGGAGSSNLSLSLSSTQVYIGRTVNLTASGGVPPYSFSIQSGAGSLTGQTYTAPMTTTTAVVRVTDSVSNSMLSQIRVVDVPQTPLNRAAFNVRVDHFFAVAYQGPSNGAKPSLTFFGMSPSGGAGVNCTIVANTPPCVQAVPLSNFELTALGTTYRGVIQVSGRGGSSNLEYCIDPSDHTVAYVKNISGSAGYIQNNQYFSTNGLMLFNGGVSRTLMVPIDTGSSGSADYTVNITGQYSSQAQCSGYMGSIRVFPW